MIDLKKYQRLQGDLEQAQMGLRAMSDDARYWADEHARLRADVVRNLRNPPSNWNGYRDPMSTLLQFLPEDLRHIGVDVPTARAAANAQERQQEMQTRIAALSARVAPLTTLVNRLNRYVEQGSN